MLRRVLSWFLARLGRNGESDSGEKTGTQFIPSRLDESVRFAHGGSSADVEREIASIQTKAQELENQQRDQ